MSKILLFLFTAFSISSAAQKTLRLINNTDKAIYMAYAYFDYEGKYWICEGWYTIESYGQKDIDMADYRGSVYIHGEQPTYLGLSSIGWGSGYKFCINPKDRFTIRDALHVNCETQKEFSEKKLLDGINKWEFNP
jgi:uncharacterized membrane protein